MRTKYFKLALFTIIITGLFVGTTLAQPPREKGPRPDRGERIFDRIPDLTEEQVEQIKDLRTQHMKQVLPIRNQMQEKQAHLKSITTGDKVDMNNVNKTIEEIGELKMNLAKKREAHRQEIRKILTEDQRVIFDSLPGKRGPHFDHEGGRCYQRGDRPGKRF